MNRRLFWGIGIASGIVVILIIAGIIYTNLFASRVTETHQAPGAIVVSPTASQTATTSATTATQPKTFTIVPAKTTAAYSVYENLIFQNKPNNDAIGTTHAVNGNFKVQTGSAPAIEGMNIQVDLRTLQTDSTMRDNFVRRNSLQTDTYPYATFVSVSTNGLPANYQNGQNVDFQLTGNMTMHGKTNKEIFTVQGKIDNDTITGKATSTIYMTDFGIQPPNLANIAISQNKVDVTITFTAQAA